MPQVLLTSGSRKRRQLEQSDVPNELVDSYTLAVLLNDKPLAQQLSVLIQCSGITTCEIDKLVRVAHRCPEYENDIAMAIIYSNLGGELDTLLKIRNLVQKLPTETITRLLPKLSASTTDCLKAGYITAVWASNIEWQKRCRELHEVYIWVKGQRVSFFDQFCKLVSRFTSAYNDRLLFETTDDAEILYSQSIMCRVDRSADCKDIKIATQLTQLYLTQTQTQTQQSPQQSPVLKKPVQSSGSLFDDLYLK